MSKSSSSSTNGTAFKYIYMALQSKNPTISTQAKLLVYLLNNPMKPKNYDTLPIVIRAILMHLNIIKAMSVFRQYNWMELNIMDGNRPNRPFLCKLLPSVVYKMLTRIHTLYAAQIRANWHRKCDQQLKQQLFRQQSRSRSRFSVRSPPIDIANEFRFFCRLLTNRAKINSIIHTDADSGHNYVYDDLDTYLQSKRLKLG